MIIMHIYIMYIYTYIYILCQYAHIYAITSRVIYHGYIDLYNPTSMCNSVVICLGKGYVVPDFPCLNYAITYSANRLTLQLWFVGDCRFVKWISKFTQRARSLQRFATVCYRSISLIIIWGPLNLHWLALIARWISNNMPSKVWN